MNQLLCIYSPVHFFPYVQPTVGSVVRESGVVPGGEGGEEGGGSEVVRREEKKLAIMMMTKKRRRLYDKVCMCSESMYL